MTQDSGRAGEVLEGTEADRAVKARHRAMWALGDYPAVAADVVGDLGAILVEACDVKPGGRVLDVATGSGNAAIPAALNGASVVACDLTPELFVSGRQWAAERGAEVEWRQADAEALPFADGEFDTVMSCLISNRCSLSPCNPCAVAAKQPIGESSGTRLSYRAVRSKCWSRSCAASSISLWPHSAARK